MYLISSTEHAPQRRLLSPRQEQYHFQSKTSPLPFSTPSHSFSTSQTPILSPFKMSLTVFPSQILKPPGGQSRPLSLLELLPHTLPSAAAARLNPPNTVLFKSYSSAWNQHGSHCLRRVQTPEPIVTASYHQ